MEVLLGVMEKQPLTASVPLQLGTSTSRQVLSTNAAVSSFSMSSAGFWVHCNDSEMKVCSVEEVCNTQAYILFYTQRSA